MKKVNERIVLDQHSYFHAGGTGVPAFSMVCMHIFYEQGFSPEKRTIATLQVRKNLGRSNPVVTFVEANGVPILAYALEREENNVVALDYCML